MSVAFCGVISVILFTAAVASKVSALS